MVLTRRSRAEWDVAPQQGGFLMSMMPGALMLMFMLRCVLIFDDEVGVDIDIAVDVEVGVDI